MHVETFTFNAKQGWSISGFPQLDSPRTLVVTFGAPELGGEGEPLARALAELRAAFPQAQHFGCSTSGEIHGTTISDHSLSVAVARFDRATLASASAPVQDTADSFTAGAKVAEALRGPTLRAVLVLSDGVTVNGSELVRGLNSALPETVVVTGGLAGDGSRFKRTWVLKAGEPCEHHVVAVGIYGDGVGVSHGSQGGWDIFGPERTVTRSVGNALYEIDGKPALALYKRYLGDQAEGLPATALLFPLALRTSRQSPKAVVRTILAVDEAKGSLTFAGDIPQGSLVQLMRANFDRLIDGAAGAARTATGRRAAEGESLSIAISCVGRRLVLGERAEEEVEAALRYLPEGTHFVGFYSYGEISPFASGACDLHNQTMTLTSLWESSRAP